MKKKLAALLCGVLLVCSAASPVYARSQPPGDPAITITGDGVGDGEAVVLGGSAGAVETDAVSVRLETIGGVPYITKVYELPKEADISGYTAPFEQDGFLFTKQDVTVQQREDSVDSKTMTQTETIEVESKRVADIVEVATPVVLYNEGGYSGQLQLDAGSIVVEETGSGSYSYRVEDVREYTNLDRNDAAYVPKTVQKNGATLTLENIEWVVMGQHPVDGRMVPNLFKAIATYAGIATGQRATGYTATLTYSGTVEKMTPGNAVYTILFRGEPIAAVDDSSDAEQPAANKTESEQDSGLGQIFITVLIVLLSAACLAVGGVRLVQRIREKRGPVDDSLDDAEYLYDEEVEEPAPQAKPPHKPAQEDFWHPDELAQQAYPQDEFNLDDLFNEEGFFND